MTPDQFTVNLVRRLDGQEFSNVWATCKSFNEAKAYIPFAFESCMNADNAYIVVTDADGETLHRETREPYPYEPIELTPEQLGECRKRGRERLGLPSEYVNRFHVLGQLSMCLDELRSGTMTCGEQALTLAIERVRAMDGVDL